MSFRALLLAALALLHAYVFWRAASAPLVRRLAGPWVVAGVGAVVFVGSALAILLSHGGSGAPAATLELVAMDWMAALFLMAVALIPVDAVCLSVAPLRELAPRLRGWALGAGVLLAAIAIVQGMRPPVVRSSEVRLADLPENLDGAVLVAVSDLHVGSLLGPDWLAARVAQISSLRPDVIALVGDVVEGHGADPAAVVPVLRRLSAPLGVWAVTGNHELHRGPNGAGRPLEDAGITVLHDRWAQVRPGLVIAGVDDLTSRRRGGGAGDPIGRALAGRPPGAAILLSHTPWQAQRAASAGVGLMLCGHTHAGQIWPFTYVSQVFYPLVAGRYEVDGMPVIVCRGTGTWGPRMRLWRPSEILRITLRAGSQAAR